MEFIENRKKAIKDLFLGKISFWVMIQLMLPHYMRTFTEFERGIVIYNQYHVELIKKNATVVDAGANIGVFLFLLQKNIQTQLFMPLNLRHRLSKNCRRIRQNIQTSSASIMH